MSRCSISDRELSGAAGFLPLMEVELTFGTHRSRIALIYAAGQAIRTFHRSSASKYVVVVIFVQPFSAGHLTLTLFGLLAVLETYVE